MESLTELTVPVRSRGDGEDAQYKVSGGRSSGGVDIRPECGKDNLDIEVKLCKMVIRRKDRKSVV